MRQGRTMIYMSLACLALIGLFAVAGPGAGSAAAAARANPVVVLETSMGDIAIELNAEKAPITVDNFLKYVDSGYYNCTIFHRVIEKLDNGAPFMIQGGGFTENMKEKGGTRDPIKNEAVTSGLKNLRGTIAMARTNNPDSATCQFFINLGDTKFLDPAPGSAGYASFGKVIDGMDVVDKIAKVQTTSKGPHENVPVQAVIIKSAKRKGKS